MPIPSLRPKPRKNNWRYKPLGGVRPAYSPQAWRSKKYRPRRKQGLALRLIKVIVPAGILAGLFSIVFVVSLFAWYGRDLPDPDKLLERSIAQSTTIYDRTGENILYEVHGEERRTMVELEEIPEYLVWATIVAEDRQFYEHSGFNLRRIIITAVKDIFTGQRAGASTITQQFVKNAILTPEKRYSRKIKELILSYQIENKFTKDQILKMYFNEIPYGSTAYGIEAASQIYLGKSVSELSLAEAATIAGLPQAPTYYYNHQDALQGRRDYILDSLAEFGYITQEDAELAKEEPLKLEQRKEALVAPHFVMYVKELLSQRYGERLVESGGLNIQTTLDIEKQEAAEAAVEERALNNETDYGAMNAALVALDPKTGDILAMVGSRDFYNEDIDGQVNVTTSPRQPGSSFKPIVYAASFIKGYTPKTILWDVVTTFKTEVGEDYTPHNYDNKEHGPITMRKALAGSLNIPAVKTIYLTGISKVLDLADALGYTTLYDRSRFGLSLVLGGGEVKLLEHVAAYGALSQEGIIQTPRAVLKVTDSNGEILEEADEEPTGERAMDPEICRLVSNILSDNEARAFTFGSSNYLNLGERPVAAKTGTTNDYKDAWAVGYAPSLVAGVWVGNNDNKEMKRGAAGGVVAAPIWHHFMQAALRGSPIEQFAVPAEIKAEKPVLRGETGSEVTAKIDKASNKLASSSTPPELVEERAFKEMHSILHYVDKNDPQGPVPKDPTQDSYYEPWEQAILEFLAREKEKREAGDEKAFAYDALPTEEDDVHTLENIPIVSIISPLPGKIFTTNILTARISADVPRGEISKVEYWIDSELFAAEEKSPYNLEKTILSTSDGKHTLIAKVYDDVLNMGEARVDFNIDLIDIAPAINWLYPKTDIILGANNFPLNLSISIPNPDQQRIGVVRLKFFYQAETSSQSRLLGLVTDPEDFDKIELAWPSAPGSGIYNVYVEAEDYKGEVYRSEVRRVEVE
ncbi:PBP1A family penicillin-binding protein [Patescibacteria group bacterium]|nr:PBP1A family penicillin-binding protein [Patescibacteria group bacterium]